MSALAEKRDRNFARCIACAAAPLEIGDSGAACSVCGEAYRVDAGVPLLVRDWQRHREQIDAAQQINPGWYVEAQAREAESPWRHHLARRRRFVQAAIERFLRERGTERVDSHPDLGCGDGNNLEWLGSYTRQLYGSDYNLLRLARARQRFPAAQLFLSDLLEHGGRDDYFDIVFFDHVIEHVPDDLAALRTAKRLLRPGGLLVLGTPNEGSWWWQLAYRRAPEVLESTGHVYFYTALTIEAQDAQGRIRAAWHQAPGLGTAGRAPGRPDSPLQDPG